MDRAGLQQGPVKPLFSPPFPQETVQKVMGFVGEVSNNTVEHQFPYGASSARGDAAKTDGTFQDEGGMAMDGQAGQT